MAYRKGAMNGLVPWFFVLQAAWPVPQPRLSASELAQPQNQPNDPDFAPWTQARGCEGQWGLYSFAPPCLQKGETTTFEEGPGSAVDRAWLYTIGHPSILLAFADDGFDLTDPELLARYQLNAAEIPAGEGHPHDRNGDGAFTVLDFTTATGTQTPTLSTISDPRLLARPDRGDINQNGLLDPQDLITIFADGVDDDNNGLIDDICGWDFVEDDPDPTISEASQASQRLRTAVATADNSRGGAGICPLCSALPIRVGQRGLLTAAQLAKALAYASQQQARVLSSDLWLPAPAKYLDELLRITRQKGLLYIGAVGTDGLQLTQNPLSQHLSYSVGGMPSLTNDPLCHNSVLSINQVPAGQCQSNQAAFAAGIAGLSLAAAEGYLHQGRSEPPLPGLGAPGLQQLLQVSKENVSALLPETSNYQRLSALKAVENVLQGQLGASVRFESPQKLSVASSFQQEVSIRAWVANLSTSPGQWKLAYGLGLQPENFTDLETGVASPGDSLVTAKLSLKGLFEPIQTANSAEEERWITIKLEVETGPESVNQAFTQILVEDDLYRYPGFPKQLENGVNAATRIDSATKEILVADVAGNFLTLAGTGTITQNYSLHAESLHPARWEKLIGRKDIEVPSWGFYRAPVLSTRMPGTYFLEDEGHGIWKVDQEKTQRFPPLVPTATITALSGPMLYDLDLDGEEDIINSEGSWLVARTINGELKSGFPVHLDSSILGYTVGQLDERPGMELAVQTEKGLHILDARGEPTTEAFALATANYRGINALSSQGPIVLDELPNTPRLLISVPQLASFVVDLQRRAFVGLEMQAGHWAQPTVATQNYQGASQSWLTAQGDQLELRDSEQRVQQDFPGLAGLQPFGASWADIDGGEAELLVLEKWSIKALDSHGFTSRFWPKSLAGPSLAAPSLGQLQTEGTTDVVAVTQAGLLWAFRSEAPWPGRLRWNGDRHDGQGTANLRHSPGLSSDTMLSNCNCRHTPQKRGSLPLLWGLLVWFCTRKKRSASN